MRAANSERQEGLRPFRDGADVIKHWCLIEKLVGSWLEGSCMIDSPKREEGFLGVYKCIVAMVTGGGLV